MERYILPLRPTPGGVNVWKGHCAIFHRGPGSDDVFGFSVVGTWVGDQGPSLQAGCGDEWGFMRQARESRRRLWRGGSEAGNKGAQIL